MVPQTDSATGRVYVVLTAEDEAKLWCQFAVGALGAGANTVPAKAARYADEMLDLFRRRFTSVDSATDDKLCGIDLKYGKVRLEKGTLHENEPVFVLRAQDPLAVKTIKDYLNHCVMHYCSEEHIRGVADARDTMQLWQLENPDKMKEKPGD